MKIGIYDLNECSYLNYKERLEIYKKVGFTSVGLYLDNNYMSNEEDYEDIIEYARKLGLEVNQVHIDYKISNMICEDKKTYFNYVEKKLRECIKSKIPYLVLHASKGDNAPLLDKDSIRELESLMDIYKDYNTCLCFENVRDNRNLKTILEANIYNVKMCYDLGHAYCYDDVEGLLEKYKDKIVCTHLHNNRKKDTHNTLFDGDIDCMKVIKKIDDKVDNCLEVFSERGNILNIDEFEEFVKKCYRDYKVCKGE